MIYFFAWFLVVTLLGWLAFPLVYRLFPALPERGYTLARAAGLLVAAYSFWLLASLGLAQNDQSGNLLGVLLLGGLSLSIWLKEKEAIKTWFKSNLGLVITTEIVFLLAFAAMAFIRAANPDATGTEKPMELAFINAILRSPAFPPSDPWLSGYSISYYYFGYVMTALLAQITTTPGSVAFNLMLALIFALAAVGSLGIVYNLLSITRSQSAQNPIKVSLLAPLFLLLVSNLGGLLEVLHRRGIFWTFEHGIGSSRFWQWLNIKDLTEVPAQPFTWIPDRYYWWWRASRVIQDYDLAGNFREVIDEFPFFSFLLGDLHPHVLAIPFGLLIVSIGLNIFLGGWRDEFALAQLRLPIDYAGFAFAALALGGIAFINTWDILFSGTLLIAAYGLYNIQKSGWQGNWLENTLTITLPLGILAYLIYLPFFISFSSQAGGLLPNLINPTRGAHLWVMFATLMLPLMFYLLYLWRTEKLPKNAKAGFGGALAFLLLLWALSWLMGWAANLRLPDLAVQFLQSQHVANPTELFNAATLRRIESIGSLLTLLLIFGSTLTFLFAPQINDAKPQVHKFPLLLILIGVLLVIGPEFLFLQDQFGTRMNTIFKFYYQTWILWSLAAAYGSAILLQNLRGKWDNIHRVALFIILSTGLIYPVLSLPTKTHQFNPGTGLTLNSAAYLNIYTPEDAAVIAWLQSAPHGIVAEAIGGSYTNYARISTHTGLPTVLGWPGHVAQWRGGYKEQGTRSQDIATLYQTNSFLEATQIIERYNIQYIIVGQLERSTYQVSETKFKRFLEPVFQVGNSVIYALP